MPQRETISAMRHALLMAGVIGGLTGPLAGQATPDTGYCQFTPTTIASFSMEYARGLADLQSTLQGSVPPDILNQILSGQKELRDRITWDAATGKFRNIVFLADPGSPVPSPAGFDYDTATILFIDVAIDKVYTSCKPYASFMFVGKIIRGVPLLGDPAGAPYMFTAGYNLDPPNQMRVFRDIISCSAGLGNAYHDYAPGSIKVAVWPADMTFFYPFVQFPR